MRKYLKSNQHNAWCMIINIYFFTLLLTVPIQLQVPHTWWLMPYSYKSLHLHLLVKQIRLPSQAILMLITCKHCDFCTNTSSSLTTHTHCLLLNTHSASLLPLTQSSYSSQGNSALWISNQGVVFLRKNFSILKVDPLCQ